MSERDFNQSGHEFQRQPGYPRPEDDDSPAETPVEPDEPDPDAADDLFSQEQHPLTEEPVGEDEEEQRRAEEREPEEDEPRPRRGGGRDTYTIGEVVARLRQEFPALSVSKVRYLERRKLINLSRTRGGYRLFSQHDVDLLRHILTLQERDYLPLKVIKKRIESGDPIPSSRSSEPDGPQVAEERVYSRQELAEALETEHSFVDELVSVGIIGRNEELTQRDLEIARLALEMARYSIQPRHLRGIMAAVDREAAMFKQVLNPELRSGDEQRMQEAVGKARHLASVDSRMKELMMSSIIETFAR